MFEDETELYPGKNSLMLGMIALDLATKRELNRALKGIVRRERVTGEIHFRELRPSASETGVSGAQFRVAYAWLNTLYDYTRKGKVWITVLQVNETRLFPASFTDRYQVYNRFSWTCLKSTLRRYDHICHPASLRLSVWCDDHCLRASTGTDRGDNYAQYLRQQLTDYRQGQQTPPVDVHHVRLCDSEDHLLLQLTDCMLGAIRQCVVRDATRRSKVLLGDLAERLFFGPSVASAVPWGRLSLEYFPSDNTGVGESQFGPIVPCSRASSEADTRTRHAP